MLDKYQYIINEETAAIFNTYNEEGNLDSLVVEGDLVLEVKVSPLQIIEDSINYYGGSLDGAQKGARKALGNVSMPPVQVSCKRELYWFPSKSSTHEDCAWFAVDHIDDYNQSSKKLLKVYFRNGYQVTIDSSYLGFDNKLKNALKFKNIMINHSNKNRYYYKGNKNQYRIIKDSTRNHYRVDKKED